VGSGDQGWREGRVATAAGEIGQRVKAAGEKGFNPGADGLFVLTEMVGNAGHGPPGVREAEVNRTRPLILPSGVI
jgi:hypothetical protein